MRPKPPPGVLANDVDPDGQSPSAVLVSGPASGTLAFHADGSFEYVPAPNAFGVVSFVYRATDGVLDSADATVTIATESVNDAPTADPQTRYSIEGVAIDAGEPGRNDTLAIVIRAPGGEVAADVRGRLADGNVQAHR